MTQPPRRRLPLFWLRAAQQETGSAAVEFALIAPVILLILAVTFEIGLTLRAKSRLVGAISATAHQTLDSAATVDDGTAQTVATALLGGLAGRGRSATVNLNNAVTARLEGGTIVVTDTGAPVANCYCPTWGEAGYDWNASMACNTDCADGSLAGRFVQITAQAPFTSILGAYSFFSPETLQNSAVVRLP
ncbi:TadE-like protein [Roseinatronobacter thiooxidans]|uniref:TadE-like protein n=1 Tax=Roseinatronobacter thiooxidans TaxID=121821 RepID=A0A2W7RRK0_9RHOB|nr:TadE/TadG family type IV pilus assembly protein [Roseinatronobacter thiooxidans]PZX40692.1 TadE-like protein [Roseinatronobacter thiooxidans]